MKVYLVRHALAEDHNPAGDAERALTPKGRLRMAKGAKGLRDLKVHPEIILSSPMRRALETATLLAEGLGGVRTEVMAELAEASIGPADILAALHPYDAMKEIALVGHEPWLSKLAAFMLTGSTQCRIDLKKGGVICLRSEPEEGEDRFVLLWSLPPNVLRSL
jgi:phosphohistidine phosphatase